MKEAIERVIAELEEGIKINREGWKATKDDWFKGVVHGKEGNPLTQGGDRR